MQTRIIMKIFKLFFVFIPLFGLMSCGISGTATRNITNVNTNVDLSRKNFVVLGNVSGSANSWYLFGVGGFVFHSLLGNAYRDMERKANLRGTSRVITSVTYDIHTTWIIVYLQYKITVSGTVIEFVDDNYEFDRGREINRNPRTNIDQNRDANINQNRNTNTNSNTNRRTIQTPSQRR